MSRFCSLLAIAALCLAIPTGCAYNQGDPSDDSDGALRITRQDTCAASECSLDSDQDCDRCLDACFDAMMNGVALDCDSSCHYSCAPRDCAGSPCVETKYVFVVKGPADDTAEAVCLQVAGKGEPNGPSQELRDSCHLLAKIYDPSAAIPAWKCELREGCPEDGSYTPPPLGSVGDEYCEGVKSTGWDCDKDFREGLNELEYYYRREAIDALRTCFAEPSKSAIHSCIQAWLSLGL